ncbi:MULTISPECIES: hypothetical protein [Afipia]|uniref:TIR domain-containing protein n=1 Tax=Afipia massiliensis TaxID=211460 RepID=A0A840NA70_9BRAD|nr:MULTISPECIES: hypothetical protein [Afipia]MBB5053606.1 hypothetical protein [Afipia massiliensis]WIG52235.1 MAG: hypothetical protein OJF48_003153 [Afipia sp.]
MTFFTAPSVRVRAQNRASRIGLSVPEAFNREAKKEEPRYDVFLSQTVRDLDLVYGVYSILNEDLGLAVFCDWIASDADRSHVTPRHARAIRDAMSKSTSFVFLDTPNSSQSTWMSWELGWFDGTSGRIAIFPILNDPSEQYRGREFIGLYPTVEKDSRHTLVVRLSDDLIRARVPAGVAMGLATSLPFTFWLTQKSAYLSGT